MLKDIMKALLIMFLILTLIWGIIVFIDAFRVYNYKTPKFLVLSIMTDTIYSSDGTSDTVYTCLGYTVGISKKHDNNEIIGTSMSVLGKHIFTHDKREKNLKENTNNNVNYKSEYINDSYVITNTME